MMSLIIIDMVDGMTVIESNLDEKPKKKKQKMEILQPELPLQEIEPEKPTWRPPPLMP